MCEEKESLRFCGSCIKISEGVGLGIPFLGALTCVAGIAQRLQVIGIPELTAQSHGLNVIHHLRQCNQSNRLTRFAQW
jgi:hypothetical protein